MTQACEAVEIEQPEQIDDQEEHIQYWHESSWNDLLSREQKALFGKIVDFNLLISYLDYNLDFYKRCTNDYASEYFSKIKELHQWMISLIK